MTRIRRFAALSLAIIGLILSVHAKAAHPTQLLFVGEAIPPLQYHNQQMQITGAVAEEVLALKLPDTLTSSIVLMPLARAIEMAKHEPNVILMTLLKDPERTPDFQWIGPILSAKASLYRLATQTQIQPDSVTDLTTLRTAAMRGYSSTHYLQGLGLEDEQALTLTSNYRQLWAMLFEHRVDLVLANTSTYKQELQQLGFRAEQVHEALALPALNHELYLATGKNTAAEVVTQLKSLLLENKKNGTYGAILTKWGLEGNAIVGE